MEVLYSMLGGNEELCVGHNSFILEEMNLLKK